MTQSLASVRFLQAGWCSQFARLAGASSWNWTRFYAVFVYLEHPVHGASLIDTGYSKDFLIATSQLPERFYRWVTPVHLAECGDARGQLQAAGLDPETIQTIFISHFHADHVAGLKCFPKAKFVYRPEAYERTIRASRLAQIRGGFLRDLMPQDFRERGIEVPQSRFVPGTGDWWEFKLCDYWGDGSLILLDLPGHADGQTGFVLQTRQRPVVYIVDACWHVQALEDQVHLPWISRNFQHDSMAYDSTQGKLRRLAQSTGLELVACHCPRTLNHVS